MLTVCVCTCVLYISHLAGAIIQPMTDDAGLKAAAICSPNVRCSGLMTRSNQRPAAVFITTPRFDRRVAVQYQPHVACETGLFSLPLFALSCNRNKFTSKRNSCSQLLNSCSHQLSAFHYSRNKLIILKFMEVFSSNVGVSAFKFRPRNRNSEFSFVSLPCPEK